MPFVLEALLSSCFFVKQEVLLLLLWGLRKGWERRSLEEAKFVVFVDVGFVYVELVCGLSLMGNMERKEGLVVLVASLLKV